MKKEQIFLKVVFLDTMTLHYIRLCLESAKKDDILFSTDEQTISKLKNNFSNVREESLKESLLIGLKTIVLLSRNDVQIEYAPVSELEMLTGIAEGKARINVAKEGVPHRMWSRFSETEIRDRITAKDLADIKTRIDTLSSMLKESGVTVTRSDSNRTNEVIELAKGIVGLIYMDEMDSIIYASAVAAGADYLVTADGYLKETINNIRNSQDQRYEEIRQKLNELISEVILKTSDELETSDEFELPQAFTVTHKGKLKGVSSFP